ncbi:MAG: hypothetical protein VX619_10560 [bacterium]|nr:hypothetical protein [bacterium]
MAELILKLRRNVETGKQDLYIDYESAGDSLPFEHEEEHRDMVRRVIEELNIDTEDLGNIYIERQPVELSDSDEEIGDTTENTLRQV